MVKRGQEGVTGGGGNNYSGGLEARYWSVRVSQSVIGGGDGGNCSDSRQEVKMKP